MSETKIIRLVASDGKGIPRTLKAFRSVNVQSGSSDQGRNKVICVAVPSNVVLGKSSQAIPEQHSRSEDDGEGACLSKNALLARENRRKRKQYVAGLESNLNAVKKDNEAMKNQLKERDLKIEHLEKEVTYLKSVLANIDEISGLVNTIRRSSSLPITSSIASSTQAKKLKLDRVSECSSGSTGQPDLDFDDWKPTSPIDSFSDLDSLSNLHIPFQYPHLSPKEERAGVCLHVLDKKISLEFCSACSSRASENWASQI